MRDRLAAGRRVLAPLTQVRILVPQPSNHKGLWYYIIALFSRLLKNVLFMTPYEMAKMIHKDLSSIAPKLSAALNRALTDIGEGSVLVGLGQGTHEDDHISFQEIETINVRGNDPANILAVISGVIWKLEEHTTWKVLVDKRPNTDPDTLELLYTIFRSKKI